MNRIPPLTHELFKAFHQIRRRPRTELPPASSLHRRLCDGLECFGDDARRAGFDSRDIDSIRYALAALLDEAVISKGGELQAHWSRRSLQLHYFGENVAGEGFFGRLTRLRADPQRAEILQVYYFCLLFGFRGRYAVRGRELELQELVESVRRDLERAGLLDDVPLSPHGEQPRSPLVRHGTRHLSLWAGAAVLALSVAAYAVLQLDLSIRVSELVDHLDAGAILGLIG